MASNNKDMRSVKTEKALYGAMFSLLNNHSFRKITIKRICEEALISRAAFYAHFIDKYDLLEHWLTEFWPNSFGKDNTYEQIERIVNSHIRENMSILKNLIYDADNETIGILFDFILSAMDMPFEKNGGKSASENIVLSNFYAGGIISYLSWQIKNNFPSDVPPMSRYLYEVINELQDWQSK